MNTTILRAAVILATGPRVLGSSPGEEHDLTATGFFRTTLVTCAASLVAWPAAACSLALVLALDVSASIDSEEYALQQVGLADALQDPDVRGAILAQGGIWVTAYEWSGARHQYEQLPWTYLDSDADISEVSTILRNAPRRAKDFPTSLGYALGHGLITLGRAPETCRRQVIDVSSDGETNDGFGPDSAYRAHDMSGVTVNALVIEEHNPSTVDYYRDEVIRGNGAFVEVARTYEDYAVAMRRKLLREIGVFAFAGMQPNR
ncbi:MAG TPA: hypothetical protein DEO85_05360 [Maritimibacter sp.]|nr:hypothetical protein [Maritimibacter sp.]